MSKTPISVIFTTYNEAQNIGAALDAVIGWASEIIVVDSFSTDETPDIVRRYAGVYFKQRKYVGPSDQKNWAIPQAAHEWVLLVDADERVTSDLREEINEIVEAKTIHFDGYWIGFRHFFMGQQVKYSGWQNDKTIRLIRRDVCRYNNNRVHEEIARENLRIGRLKNKFDHYTFKDFAHFVEKQARYARWSAEDYANKTKNVTYFHLLLKPLFRFCKHFILKRGFLDGKVGFFISIIAAWTVFLRYATILENRKKDKKR
jgi:glycosyltransferase involved in cell wall biosynthesis